MAAPTITALPNAPSRTGDPTNFASESLAFLAAQPDFGSECNAVSSYLNGLNLNPFDWGDLGALPVASSGSITNQIDPLPTNPPLSDKALVTAIDSLFVSMVDFVPDANAVISYIDGLYDPLAEVVSDPERPMVATVTASQTRNDGQAVFESKALSFYATARNFGLSLNNLALYANDVLAPLKDWGLINEVYTDTDDWGFIV